MLFRLPRILLCRPMLRSTVKHSSTQNLPKVNVRSSADEDFIEISFKHEIIPRSNKMVKFIVNKDQTLHQVINRIKPIMTLQKKRDQIVRDVDNQDFEPTDVETFSDESDVDVALIKEDIVLDNDVKNIDAWTEGSLLKIGDIVFEVSYNTPTIKELTLPHHIVAGCYIRPHAVFDCALPQDCEFHWFRKILSEEVASEDEDEKNWLKVSENCTYQVSPEDVGHKLKLVCTAKHGGKSGQTFFTISKNVVEACPDSFPFVGRHQFLRDLADSDCIRCASYNTLAKVYVERRRFPYCSQKARDEYYRKQLLLKEISGFNSDILCLQEVQERAFEFDFLPVLKSYNFDGVYDKKNIRGQDGLALFYRTTKFKLLEKQHVHLNVIAKNKKIVNDLFVKVSGSSSSNKDIGKLLTRDTVLQLVLLQPVDKPTKKVLIANTHLYANKDMPEVRLIQSALCTSYAQYVLKSEKNANSTALIFCGDFNSLPGSAAHKFITEGIYDCSNWKSDSSIGDNDMTLRHSLPLASACGTPTYTNFTEEFNGCLDYIFYSTDYFQVSEVVPMPPHDAVTKQVALPSEFFPSDHLPLICTLKWKSWNV